MTRPATIGLFEGVSALSLAVEEVFDAELIAYSEHEPATEKNPRPTQAAARLLAYRRPGIPNLGDITQIDWSAVDLDPDRMLILTGGFPCQDLSLAGLGAGLRPGTRSGLWSHMAYAIACLRPDFVVIENVRGLLSADAACDLEPCPWCVGDDEGRPLRALGAVLGDLAELGYDAVWVGLRAADVGAPHPRFRVFVLAWPAADTDGVGPVRSRDARRGRAGSAHDDRPAHDGPPVAHADHRAGYRERARPEPRDGGEATPDSDRDEPAWEQDERTGGAVAPGRGPGAWGDYGPAIQRWELILGRPAPAPTQAGVMGGQQLSPRFVEWLMGLPEGWVTDPAIGLSRNEQLARLGNGVVPQQAAAALRYLLGATGRADLLAVAS